MSKLTFWPSLRVRMPAASTAETCTNTSLPPPSGEMKPKPFAELKNFTVPMVIDCSFKSSGSVHASCGNGRGNKNIRSVEVFRFVRRAVAGQKDRSASSDLGRKNHVGQYIGVLALIYNQDAFIACEQRLAALQRQGFWPVGAQSALAQGLPLPGLTIMSRGAAAQAVRAAGVQRVLPAIISRRNSFTSVCAAWVAVAARCGRLPPPALPFPA